MIYIFLVRFVKKLEHSWKALVHDGVSSSQLEALLFLPLSLLICPLNFLLPYFICGFYPSARLSS